MKFLLLASAMTLLSVNVNAKMGSDEALEAQVEEQMGSAIVQKISNHFYDAKKLADGTKIVSVYWTGKKVFQKDDACLVMEQKLSHFESHGSDESESKEREAVVTQKTRVTDCEPAVFLI
jgi:hypothetical protein